MHNTPWLWTHDIQEWARNTCGFQLPVYKYNTKQYQHSFFIQTVVDWNHLEENIVKAGSASAFTSALSRSTPPSKHTDSRGAFSQFLNMTVVATQWDLKKHGGLQLKWRPYIKTKFCILPVPSRLLPLIGSCDVYISRSRTRSRKGLCVHKYHGS